MTRLWRDGVSVLAVAATAALWFAAAPARATEITRVQSPGGIEAWLVREPSIPMLAVEMLFRGGAALDPAGKEGLANMVSGLLDEGAGDLDSLAFQTRIEELAIGLSFDARLDYFSVSLKTLTGNQDEAFRLLSLALSQPRFDAGPVARVRGQIRAMLTRASEDPGSILDRTWYRAAFPDHPYGRPVDGTLDSIAAIGAEDLRTFVRGRFARDNLIIGVVGDIDAVALGRLLDRTFAPLPARATPWEIAEATAAKGSGTIVVRKNIPQSVVMFGGPGLKRDDPDYYAGYVMNYVLGGGGLISRLTEEVREKRGLAYSVYSYLYPMDRAGLLLGGVGTANERVADSLRIIRKELGRLREEGVSATELADAKTYLNGSFPLRLSSNGRIANILVAIQRGDLGIDYIERRPELINAVTREDIRRVAQRLLREDELIVVVVGDPAGIDGGG